MKRQLIRCGLSILVLFCALAPAQAQSRGVRIDLSAGYDGQAHYPRPFPVVVTISNEGADLSGRLDVVFAGQRSGVVSQQVELPRGSRKKLLLWQQNDGFGNPVIEARLMVDGERVAFSSQPLTMVAAELPLLARVSDGPSAALPDNLDLVVGQQLSQVSLALDELPEQDGLLGGLDMIVLGEGSLSDAQAGALRRWVLSGGTLVVDGGANARPPQQVESLLPATLGPLVDGSGLGLAGQMRQLSALGAARLLPDAQRPLWAERQLGAGVVRLSAISPAELGGAEHQAFWTMPMRNLFGPPMQVDIPPDLQMLQMSLPELTLPSLGTLALFILIYILLIGPVNYLLLRRLDRKEWAWFSIPGGVLLFTLAAYLLGFGLRGGTPILMDVSMIHTAPGETTGLAASSVGYVATVRDAYRLSIESPTMATWPFSRWGFGGGSSTSDDIVLDQASIPALEAQTDIGQFSQVFTYNPAPVPFQIEGHISADKLVVKNTGLQPVPQAYLLMGQDYLELSLAPGETRTVALGELQCCFPFGFSNDGDFQQQALYAAFSGGQFFMGDMVEVEPVPMPGMPGSEIQPMLVVLSDQPAVPVALDRPAQRLSASLYIFYLPREDQP